MSRNFIVVGSLEEARRLGLIPECEGCLNEENSQNDFTKLFDELYGNREAEKEKEVDQNSYKSSQEEFDELYDLVQNLMSLGYRRSKTKEELEQLWYEDMCKELGFNPKKKVLLKLKSNGMEDKDIISIVKYLSGNDKI